MEISDQKEWERSMTSLGVSRFREQERKAKDGGRYADTSAGSRLIRVYLSQVSEKIAETINYPRQGGRRLHTKLLQGIDYDKLAMFTLTKIMQCVFDPKPAQSVAQQIGVMVEDELRFSQFEIETPEFFNAVIRDLDSRNSNQYRHRHRVLVDRMNDRSIEWQCWSNSTHIQVGVILLGCVFQSSDIIQKVQKNGPRGGWYIEPTPEALEWISQHDESMEIMFPDRMPCLIQPNEWTDWKTGGFFTKRLRGKTPLVKTRSGQQRDTQSPLLDEAEMPTVLNSVNSMQNTSWKINNDVLDVVKEVWDRGLEIGMPRSTPYEIPPAPIPENKKPEDLTGEEKEKFTEWKEEARTLHGLEGERKSAALGVVRAMRMASRMEHLNLLWLVYQLDFRSRTYSTTSGVSPQGDDVSKSLLKFGEAKELGKDGWYWFQVHGANKYGEDKVNYNERVKWIQDNSAALVKAGLSPIENADTWKDADKPYQFLAWCIEYASAINTVGGPEAFKSSLPIALDGSCNGLQHFSAMLSDPVGGKSVNLVPADQPSDIYQDVADVATEKIKDIMTQPDHPEYTMASNWMALFEKLGSDKMGRKIAKKPVMTLPYGSTLQTCTQTVHGWYLEQKKDFFPEGTGFKHSVWLSKVIWKSIGEVVIAARAAMSWIQKCARLLAKHDEPIIYKTPVGFPMVQFAPNTKSRMIQAQIGGRVQLTINEELPGVNPAKSSSGSSPNLVHSVDAAHMHMVVEEGAKQGITHFAMIHDDFGVHACHIPEWHKIIREKFIELHSNTDILEDFKTQQEERTGIELPDVPERGSLDLNEVAKSPFFFG